MDGNTIIEAEPGHWIQLCQMWCRGKRGPLQRLNWFSRGDGYPHGAAVGLDIELQGFALQQQRLGDDHRPGVRRAQPTGGRPQLGLDRNFSHDGRAEAHVSIMLLDVEGDLAFAHTVRVIAVLFRVRPGGEMVAAEHTHVEPILVAHPQRRAWQEYQPIITVLFGPVWNPSLTAAIAVPSATAIATDGDAHFNDPFPRPRPDVRVFGSFLHHGSAVRICSIRVNPAHEPKHDALGEERNRFHWLIVIVYQVRVLRVGSHHDVRFPVHEVLRRKAGYFARGNPMGHGVLHDRDPFLVQAIPKVQGATVPRRLCCQASHRVRPGPASSSGYGRNGIVSIGFGRWRGRLCQREWRRGKFGAGVSLFCVR